AGVRVVIHYDRDVQKFGDALRERKVPPAAHMRGKRDALPRELHGSAETDAAPVEAAPVSDDRRDFTEHPLRPALAIRRAGLAMNHAFVLKRSDRELGAADVNGESAHE